MEEGSQARGSKCRLLAWSLLGSTLLGGTVPAASPYVDGPALTYTLQDLDGHQVPFDDDRFEGKVVLVDLWGTWCPPCLTEIPTFVDLQDRYRDEGLVIVGISFERMDNVLKRRALVRSYADRYGMNYLLLDGGTIRRIADALPTIRNIGGLPVEILIDRDGRVLRTRNGNGYSKKWARKLEKELRETLGLADAKEGTGVEGTE